MFEKVLTKTNNCAWRLTNGKQSVTSHAACVYPLKKHGVSDDGVYNTMKRVVLGIDK